MKRPLFFFFVVLWASPWMLAQKTAPSVANFGSHSPVTVTYERNDKGEVLFWGDNLSYVPYTVTFTFTNLTNTATLSNGEAKSVVARTGNNRLLTLRPTDTSQGIGFSYRIQTRKGDYSEKPDTHFVYLFPLVEGKPVRVNPLVSLEKVLGKPDKPRVTGMGFKTNDGDTITAIRRGVVAEIRDNSASTGDNKAFSATENFVEVYHEDGTFARYMLFRNGGIFVTPGDDIIPGQPIGIIGASNYKQGSHLRLSFYSPALDDHAFIPPFYLGGGKTGVPDKKELYASEHPKERVMQEMSKKEKKKYMEH